MDLESICSVAVEPPQTRYTRSGNVNIAYQVVGDGPLDLVLVFGWISNIELAWEEPHLRRFLDRLASFSRLILFDKRGTGLSDRVSLTDLPTLEQRMDDVRAVMDAAGSERAALLGMSEGGPMCILFAATYPDRTVALVTCGTYAKRRWSADYPWAPTPEERQVFFDAIEFRWGEELGLDSLAPSRLDDPTLKRWLEGYMRRSASPSAALALARMNTDVDVRDVLPSVRVPALIMHRDGDRDARVDEGRYIATQIPGPGSSNCTASTTCLGSVTRKRYSARSKSFSLAYAPSPSLTEFWPPSFSRTSSAQPRWLPRSATSDGGTSSPVTTASSAPNWHGSAGEIDIAGDGFLASFDGPARAVRCASAIISGVRISASRFGPASTRASAK